MLDDKPEWIQTLFSLNPMVAFLDIYRSAFLGYPLDGWSVVYGLAWGLGLAAVGSALFIRYEGRMARYL